MKTLRLILIVLLAATLLLSIGCSRNRNKRPAPQGDEVYYPAWYDRQEDPVYVYAYGVATWVSENSAINAAEAAAQAAIARYVEAEVQTMLKLYEEEAGIFDPQILRLSQNVVRSVSNVRFRGLEKGRQEVRRVREHNSDRYKVWVQYRIPRNEVNQRTAQFIRNEEALYNQFRASQAFMELDSLLP